MDKKLTRAVAAALLFWLVAPAWLMLIIPWPNK